MVRFRVSLSHPQHQMISAAYETRDGTARAGEDYEASSGMVTLAPGTVEGMIAVPLLKDGPDWRQETFTVHLVSSKHAEIGKAVGVATIQESNTASEEVLEGVCGTVCSDYLSSGCGGVGRAVPLGGRRCGVWCSGAGGDGTALVLGLLVGSIPR